MGRWTRRLRELKETSGVAPTAQAGQGTATPSESSIMTDPEITWRVAVMRPRVSAKGPIPCLVARSQSLAQDAPRRCLSCGDELQEGRKARCAYCVLAIEAVLNEVREGVKYFRA